jgi:alkylation response protein AidB-like acyl-CoA dehydrogenase
MTQPAGVLDRVERLVPQVAASADAIEAGRRLPAPLLAALHEGGMFRLLRALGGAELDPATFVQVTERIAEADASTAWVLCQSSSCRGATTTSRRWGGTCRAGAGHDVPVGRRRAAGQSRTASGMAEPSGRRQIVRNSLS